MNTEFRQHKARVIWITLVCAFNSLEAGRLEARIPTGTIFFCVTPALDPAADRFRLCSNCMGWTVTAVTAP
jgi:hypothetical protein